MVYAIFITSLSCRVLSAESVLSLTMVPFVDTSFIFLVPSSRHVIIAWSLDTGGCRITRSLLADLPIV